MMPRIVDSRSKKAAEAEFLEIAASCMTQAQLVCRVCLILRLWEIARALQFC